MRKSAVEQRSCIAAPQGRAGSGGEFTQHQAVTPVGGMRWHASLRNWRYRFLGCGPSARLVGQENSRPGASQAFPACRPAGNSRCGDCAGSIGRRRLCSSRRARSGHCLSSCSQGRYAGQQDQFPRNQCRRNEDGPDCMSSAGRQPGRICQFTGGLWPGPKRPADR